MKKAPYLCIVASEQVKSRNFDGMIITGAPVENLDFTAR